jgi:hypothetical protein
VRDDAHGHELLAVVATVHHQRVGEALNDGAVGLAEPLGGPPARRVRDIDRVADRDVVTARASSTSASAPCPPSCVLLFVVPKKSPSPPASKPSPIQWRPPHSAHCPLLPKSPPQRAGSRTAPT